MAVITQTYVAVSQVIPMSTNLSEPARYSSSEPYARLVHRETAGDDVTLDATTGTDTANLRIEFDVPDNCILRLLNARVTIYTPDVTILDSYAELYLLPGPPPDNIGNATLVNQPLSHSHGAVSVANVESNITLQLGNSSANGNAPSIAPYNGLPLFYGTPGGDGMIWNIPSSDAARAAGTFSYWAEWLMYDVQQGEHSTLHWPVPVT